MDSIFPWTGKLPELARAASNMLANEWDVDAIWLFGSVARGSPTTDSDIDLLVVVPESQEPRHRRAQKAHRLLREIRAPKDIIVLTRKEWERDLPVNSSMAGIVQREGVCLYGR